MRGLTVNSVLASTTKAQVSGHQFLTRRVEHGVVLGDVRMISDPLGSRRRAVLFGLIGTAIIAAGSGALALFAPAVDPGDASIIRAESGALYVRLEDSLHPVANEASARLIVGAPESAAKASISVLEGQRRGIPVGILGAPGIIAPHPQPAQQWSAVHDGGAVTVVAGPAPAPLADAHGILARVDGRTWVVTAFGRAELPPEDTPLGRSIRRRLGITVDTPVWQPPAQLLSAVKELPPYQQPQGTLLESGDEFWLRTDRGLLPLSELQFDIARDLGLPTAAVQPTELLDIPDTVRQVAELPLAKLQWQHPERVWVLGGGQVALGGEVPAGIAIAGSATASTFAGPTSGAIGVDTGHGVVLVTDYGTTHRIVTLADATALGITEPQPAPWPILALLPEGAELSRAAALQPQS